MILQVIVVVINWGGFFGRLGLLCLVCCCCCLFVLVVCLFFSKEPPAWPQGRYRVTNVPIAMHEAKLCNGL